MSLGYGMSKEAPKGSCCDGGCQEDKQTASCQCSEKKESPRAACADPYPAIKVSGENLKYARILQQNMSSDDGELTAITQYTYQSWILHPSFPDAASVLHQIAIVEMQHMNMLGELITLLGCAPSYSFVHGRRNIFWNSSFVCYNQDTVQFLNRNVRAEQEAIDGYCRSIELIDDECITSILHRIIKDEEIHIEIFKKLLCQF